MIKTINNTKVEITLADHFILWEAIKDFIKKGLEMWVNRADYYYKGKYAGTWRLYRKKKFINCIHKLYIEGMKY